MKHMMPDESSNYRSMNGAVPRRREFVNRILRVALAVLAFGGATVHSTFAAPASESGSSVVVIYNSRVPESRQVAEYYAQRRAVPAEQVIGFELTTAEAMTRAEFTEKLQKPLLEKLEKNKLFTFRTDEKGARRLVDARVRYAVLCYGVPTKIGRASYLVEPGMDDMRPEIRRNEASVDSDLACLPITDPKFILTGPWFNPLYGATNGAALHPTNGILIVGRLDGPSPAIARGTGGQGARSRDERAVGARVF